MCDEAIGDSLTALKPFPSLFVTTKMIKHFFTTVYADENVLYFNKDSGNAVFNCNGMALLNIDLNNINLDNNFDEDDPNTIILISLLAWDIKFEKSKAHKKELNKE